jgi:hypothetical protein
MRTLPEGAARSVRRLSMFLQSYQTCLVAESETERASPVLTEFPGCLSFLTHKKIVPPTLAFCIFLVTCNDVIDDEGSTYVVTKSRIGAPLIY